MTKIKPADPSVIHTFAQREASALEAVMRDDLTEALADHDPFLAEVLDYALFGGGKRIRPLLTILCSRVCGRTGQDLYRLGAAFEYLHAATLVHDDVIDHAGTRRGRASAGQQYGMTAAILAGDWLHARSMRLIGRFAGPEGLEIFCRSTTGMVDGEFLQLRYVGDCRLTEEHYFDIIHRKTALLIASTCEIGGLFAGAAPEQRAALATYGQKFGAAFQVIDDLLDYFGDTSNTGKKTGNDYVEGKITLPLIRTLTAAEPADRKYLQDLIGGVRTDPEEFEMVCRLINLYGGFGSTRATAEKFVSDGLAALDVFSETGDRESLSMLSGLAQYILVRDR